MNQDKLVYPICVIGGGSAGVMSVLRSVLNNDECLFFPGTPKHKKKSRAFWVSKIENMPAHFEYKKGIENPNKETLEWIKQSSFSKNLVYQKNEGVTKLTKLSSGEFEIHSSKGEVFHAEHVVLCTGVMDIQPEIGGSIDPILPYANVQLVDYCLRCDGHHALDKNLSVIGNGDGAAWVGIMLYERYGCKNVYLVSHGKKMELSEDVSKLVKLYNFKIFEEEITGVDGDSKNNTLKGLKLSDGSFIETDLTFISLGMIVYNELAKMLNAKLDKRGFVITDDKGESSVPGLFVAGDLRANSKKQIYTAWDHAVDAVDKINGLIRLKRRTKLLETI